MARTRSEKTREAYQQGKDRAYTGGSDPGTTSIPADVVGVLETTADMMTFGFFSDRDKTSIERARREGYKDGLKERENPK